MGKGKYKKGFINIGTYFLLFLLLFDLLNNPSDFYPPFILILLFACILFSKYILKIKEDYLVLIIVASYLAIAGEKFGFSFFQHFYYYDKFLHFSTGIMMTYILFDYFKEKGLKDNLGLFSLLSTLGVGVIWEIIEYFVDLNVNPDIKMQGVFSSSKVMLLDPTGDTIWDFISALIGSSLFLLIIYIKFNLDKRIKNKIKN